jgi:segregation and condensation protein B
MTTAVTQAQPRNPSQSTAIDWGDTPGGLAAAIEAVLMVAEEPVSVTALAHCLQLTPEQVRQTIDNLADHYRSTHRGFQLKEIADGWQIYSRADLAEVVEHFIIGGQQSRLSQAALETLAVIAYRQPISRARVGAVRGVNVDGVIRTLIARGLIEEAQAAGESGATLYQTTPLLLERLGLANINDLPPLAPHLPELAMFDDLAEFDSA